MKKKERKARTSDPEVTPGATPRFWPHLPSSRRGSPGGHLVVRGVRLPPRQAPESPRMHRALLPQKVPPPLGSQASKGITDTWGFPGSSQAGTGVPGRQGFVFIASNRVPSAALQIPFPLPLPRPRSCLCPQGSPEKGFLSSWGAGTRVVPTMTDAAPVLLTHSLLLRHLKILLKP